MNHIKCRIKLQIAVLLLLSMALASCEEYLDKAIEQDLSQEEIFKDFFNAQSFVEELHLYVTDYSDTRNWSSIEMFAYADAAISNQTNGYDAVIDRGEHNWWEAQGAFYHPNYDTDHHRLDKGPCVWNQWDGIRKANIVIESEDLMGGLTPEEKNCILGQAYFFRAYVHFEIMRFWGRIPYLTSTLNSDNWKQPRPATYKEVALQADADFDKAIELLPAVSWDNYEFGQRTLGKNALRVVKTTAWAYKGKNLLYAASPLMNGSDDTYHYDTELCARAADAFAEVMKSGEYQLAPWDKFHNVFYIYTPQDGKNHFPGLQPGRRETIFTTEGGAWNGWGYKLVEILQVKPYTTRTQGAFPSHKYIFENFGMVDGLTCDESPLYSGNPYDPANRDPRYHLWLTLDGDKMVTNVGKMKPADRAQHEFAQLYEGGAHRGGSGGSLTGYVVCKFFKREICNQQWDRYKDRVFPRSPLMRLGDVYLMYAEALLAAKGNATTAPSSYSMTAEEAVNTIRARSNVANVAANKVSDFQLFMDEIRRERAVELAWEAHRYGDLNRWKLTEREEYRKLTALSFDEDHLSTGDYREVELRTRVFDKNKHYWLPFHPDDVLLYEGFEQNPGW